MEQTRCVVSAVTAVLTQALCCYGLCTGALHNKQVPAGEITFRAKIERGAGAGADAGATIAAVSMEQLRSSGQFYLRAIPHVRIWSQ